MKIIPANRRCYTPCLVLLANAMLMALPSAADVVLARPTAEQALWQDHEIGIFYHYDVNVFKPGWDHRQYDNFPKAEVFNPVALDMAQWMEVPKALAACRTYQLLL